MENQEQNNEALIGGSGLNAGLGHDGKPWPQTMDAKIWADEFCKRNSASDHGTMLAWFANAIMLGHDTARWEYEAGTHPNAKLTSGATAALDTE